MAVVNEKAVRDLEFDRLKERLKAFATSTLGETALATLMPFDDRSGLEQEVAVVREAIAFLEQKGRFSLGGVADLAPILKRAKERSAVSGEELLIVLETIEAARAVRTALLSQEKAHPLLHRLGGRLSEMGGLAKRLHRALDERGEIRDDASPTLRALRVKQRSIEERVEKKLRAVMERHADLVSDPVITRRGGRLVIPIKSGATGAMSFIVHDRSATGQTLYAEPASLVSENNAITELEGEIRDERVTILRELTSAVAEEAAALLRDRTILAHLDALFARASYAIVHRCAFPQFSNRIALREARHPLLPEEHVVPISLTLGDRTRMTVITGPNTGGKTVTLKTVGLLVLMAQSGIPIPTSPDSELPIVSQVRTDIGDEQSIEQNLSTFSSHMKNIVSILNEIDDQSLVLLDELGAGTDPQEGAALGLAVLESLLERDPLVAVSTHLTPLKYFAVQHPAVKTASMEFDSERLTPTFCLVEGIPGKSQAFVIAERLGLSETLVNRARAFLSRGEIRAEDIIGALERERQAMVAERERAEKALGEAKRAKGIYEERLAAFEREKEKDLSADLAALAAFLRTSQKRVEELLAELNAEPGKEKAKSAYRELAELREETDRREAALFDPTRGEGLTPGEVEVGRSVYVRSLETDGRILQLLSKDKVVIDLDGVRVSTDVADLAPPQGERGEKRRTRTTVRLRRSEGDTVSLQLNVRGMTADEALRQVAAYLDRLLLADVRQASILHGKGTGVLRDAVRNYLRSCAFVESCGPATPQEGGDGVTVFALQGNDD
jgi:DNA mismatch repair protein MutS2